MEKATSSKHSLQDNRQQQQNKKMNELNKITIASNYNIRTVYVQLNTLNWAQHVHVCVRMCVCVCVWLCVHVYASHLIRC